MVQERNIINNLIRINYNAPKLLLCRYIICTHPYYACINMRWTTKVLNSDYETFVLEFFAYPYMWSTACFDYYHTHIVVLLPSGVATQQYRAHMEDWLAACMHNIIRVEWWGGGDLSDRTSSSWCRLVGWAGCSGWDCAAGWLAWQWGRRQPSCVVSVDNLYG